MRKIACAHCPKMFRGESGLAWHQDHLHKSAPPSLDVDIAFDAEDSKVEIESLSTKIGVLQDIVDTLSKNQVRHEELREQYLRIDEQLQAFREVINKIQEEQSIRALGFEHNLAETQELARKGSNTQENILSVTTFLKEELLPAIIRHSHEKIMKVYPDQETIDNLPRCQFCRGPRNAEHRTCGRLRCVAKVLEIVESDGGRRSVH